MDSEVLGGVQAGEFEKPNLIGHEVGVGGLTEDSFKSTPPIGLGHRLRVALQIERREQQVAPQAMGYDYKFLSAGRSNRIENEFPDTLNKVFAHRPDGQERIGKAPVE